MSSIRHNPLPDYSIGPRKNQTLRVIADSSSEKSCHTGWSQLVSLSSTKQARSSRQNLLRGLFEQGNWCLHSYRHSDRLAFKKQTLFSDLGWEDCSRGPLGYPSTPQKTVSKTSLILWGESSLGLVDYLTLNSASDRSGEIVGDAEVHRWL